jgi:hypothetical protein
MTNDRQELERFAEELGGVPGRNDPARHLVEAAAKDVPGIIQEIKSDSYVPRTAAGFAYLEQNAVSVKRSHLESTQTRGNYRSPLKVTSWRQNAIWLLSHHQTFSDLWRHLRDMPQEDFCGSPGTLKRKPPEEIEGREVGMVAFR